MDKIGFSKQLKKARAEQNMTAAALAKVCDVSHIFIQQLEGASRLPSLPVLVKLCNELHITPNYLLVESLEMNEQEQFGSILKSLRSLTPKELGMIKAMIEAMINYQE